MQPGDINFVDMPPPDMPSALAASAIDAYFIGEPHAAKAELDGTGRVLYHAKDIWPHFISCVLVVPDELIARAPGGGARPRARHRGERRVGRDAPAGGCAAWSSPYFRQDEKLLHYVLTQPPDRVSYRMLTPTDDEMQRIADMALKAGILDRRLDVQGLVDRRFIPPEFEAAHIAMPKP